MDKTDFELAREVIAQRDKLQSQVERLQADNLRLREKASAHLAEEQQYGQQWEKTQRELPPTLYEARHNRRNNMSEDCQEVCECGAEMPKYKCHKEVWALKIKSIVRDSDKAREEQRETDGTAIITPEETAYAPFKVDANYMHKHKPEVGGYYVVYADGYKSFSPAKAFEDGYSPA